MLALGTVTPETLCNPQARLEYKPMCLQVLLLPALEEKLTPRAAKSLTLTIGTILGMTPEKPFSSICGPGWSPQMGVAAQRELTSMRVCGSVVQKDR